MYTIYVTYTSDDRKNLENFYNAIVEAGADKACRAEADNIRYDYFWPADKENELFLLEEWKSREAQKQHTTYDHFKKIGELKEKYGIKSAFSDRDC